MVVVANMMREGCCVRRNSWEAGGERDGGILKVGGGV